jgi:hypothetical protein
MTVCTRLSRRLDIHLPLSITMMDGDGGVYKFIPRRHSIGQTSADRPNIKASKIAYLPGLSR